ncbi:hypothetical protein C7121_12235 [Paenibacillus glucanolyticus]|jgi:hypothetical protein|uniref:Uncharacterized protein n=3 Tax=Paenibacillus TaxID=44249 RepID=A0A163DR75_9BACL|nr:MULTISPECIES: hypothetical protein [Paenibacillus]VTR56521.1 Uncharacterised protein [Actinobacillus pleuropneumoniae]AVV56826.1 hypothetical protein C7121_12235 [Paenibacillus glucanolyticus]AYB48075.1 hypothetical protein D5F53_32655 [Paenibacillus lautus]KZS43342.1 hypothetical protein AWU65_01630 [Paenibacillus glucanolyticus]KZS43388.1 hypothetical protein AWU65_25070 [Paenibacillus glucanolyticus]
MKSKFKISLVSCIILSAMLTGSAFADPTISSEDASLSQSSTGSNVSEESNSGGDFETQVFQEYGPFGGLYQYSGAIHGALVKPNSNHSMEIRNLRVYGVNSGNPAYFTLRVADVDGNTIYSKTYMTDQDLRNKPPILVPVVSYKNYQVIIESHTNNLMQGGFYLGVDGNVSQF